MMAIVRGSSELFHPPVSSPPHSSGLGLPVSQRCWSPDAAHCQAPWRTELLPSPLQPPASRKLPSHPGCFCSTASFSSRFFGNCHSLPPSSSAQRACSLSMPPPMAQWGLLFCYIKKVPAVWFGVPWVPLRQ